MSFAKKTSFFFHFDKKKDLYPTLIPLSILLILYMVGAGTCLAGSVEILKLTTINLLISLFLVLYSGKFSGNESKVLLFIFVSSFFLEYLGSSTGWPFGNYKYGQAMWPLVLGVPVFIGVNWILVSLGSFAITQHYFDELPLVLRAIIASSLMMIMDVWIEPISSFTDFWHWEQGFAPLENFVAWWIAGFIYQLAINRYFGKLQNKVLLVGLYIMMLIFFFCINIANYLWS